MKFTWRSWRWTLPAVVALASLTPALPAQQPLSRVELAEPVAAQSLPAAPADDSDPQPTPAADVPVVDAAGPNSPADAAPSESPAAEAVAPEVGTDATLGESEPAQLPGDNVVVEVIKERYPNGAVKVEREITQDSEGNYLLHGYWRAFDEQGRLIIDGRHDHNQKVGLWRKFYRGNEAPLLATAPYKDFTPPFISQGTFHGGQLHGKWTVADSKQRKAHEIEFRDGQRHGKATWYYPNGAIMLQAQYEHGRVDGDVMKFAPDTTLIAQENFESGRRLAPKVEFYDAERTVKKLETTFLHGPLAIKAPDNWDACSLAVFETRGSDEKHGAFTSWHKNGQVAKQGEFRYNLPVGKIDFWFENGQKQMEGTYVDGRQEGVWTWWHANGQKSITGEYHNGVAVGKWTWWQASGKVAQRSDMSGRPLTAPSPTPEADTETREAKLQQMQLIEPAALPRP